MQKISIIEHEEDIRQLLQIYFERLDGYVIATSADPVGCPLYHQGVGECTRDSGCGDILIVDHYLPEMSGLEFIRRQIASGCKGSTVRKAVMSVEFTPADLALAKELGCKLFPKPFRLQEIADWVGSVTRPAGPVPG